MITKVLYNNRMNQARAAVGRARVIPALVMQSVEARRNDIQDMTLYYRNMKHSKHFGDMLIERGIEQEWISKAIEAPDSKKEYDDGTCHYIKQIPEFGNRWLRVIVNVSISPAILVTAFFDRRLG